MELHRLSRELYSLELTTDPPVTAWEASFDGGETFTAGTEDGVTGYWSWLVAGEDADEGDAVAVIDRTMHPLVRDVDNPEIIVRRGPLIRYSRV